ncbi:MAG: hypothetical protein WA067_00235 [Microgenomates group bacterium]
MREVNVMKSDETRRGQRISLDQDPVIEIIRGVQCMAVATVVGIVFFPLAVIPAWRAVKHFGRAADSIGERWV